MKYIDKSWYQKPEGIPVHESAGGVVARIENGRVYVALIHEIGHADYVLPKGHVETGETPEQAAIREIAEEAGFKKLRRLAALGKKERLDYRKSSWKVIHYFLFQTDEIDAKPTDTRYHTQSEWFPLDNLPDMFWPEQKQLIEKNHRKILQSMKPFITQYTE